MVHICQTPGKCKQCPHYRFDEDYGDMACFAKVDLEKEKTDKKKKLK